MKARKFIIGLGAIIVLVAVGLIVLSLKEKNKNKIVVKAEVVHQMISEGKYFYEPEQLENELNSQKNGIRLVDLRSPDEFLENHISNAVNIPFQRILDEENAEFFSQDGKKIIYTEDESKAAEVWVLLKQLGYEDVFILKGGYRYWLDKVEKQNIMAETSKNSEKAKYDFKKELSPDE